MHAVDEVENLPLSQLIQGDEPFEYLYVPAIHIVHKPPSGPVNPLLHMQSLATMLPENEPELAGQVIQVLDVTAPVAVE